MAPMKKSSSPSLKLWTDWIETSDNRKKETRQQIKKTLPNVPFDESWPDEFSADDDGWNNKVDATDWGAWNCYHDKQSLLFSSTVASMSDFVVENQRKPVSDWPMWETQSLPPASKKTKEGFSRRRESRQTFRSASSSPSDWMHSTDIFENPKLTMSHEELSFHCGEEVLQNMEKHDNNKWRSRSSSSAGDGEEASSLVGCTMPTNLAQELLQEETSMVRIPRVAVGSVADKRKWLQDAFGQDEVRRDLTRKKQGGTFLTSVQDRKNEWERKCAEQKLPNYCHVTRQSQWEARHNGSYQKKIVLVGMHPGR